MKLILRYLRHRQYGYPHDQAWKLAKKYSN